MEFLTTTNEVEFDEKEHRYHRNGIEYTPVSNVLKIFEPKFDRATISRGVAKSRGVSVETVLQEWDKTRDDAAGYGTNIHDDLEFAWKNGKPRDKKLIPTFYQVQDLVQPYTRVYPEKRLYLDHAKIAGTADLPTERARIKGLQIIDVFDYKTNVSKGVTLYKSYLDKYGNWKHSTSKNHFLHPLDHLEASLYNKYALQLSLYAYFIEFNYKAIIGRLGIIYIDLSHRPYIMPVPYMKREVEQMIDVFKSLKNVA